METVIQKYLQAALPPRGGSGSGNGIGSGEHPGIESRFAEFEKVTTDIRERVARIESCLSHVATKHDVSALETTVLKWFVGTAIALVGVTFAAARVLQ